MAYVYVGSVSSNRAVKKGSVTPALNLVVKKFKEHQSALRSWNKELERVMRLGANASVAISKVSSLIVAMANLIKENPSADVPEDLQEAAATDFNYGLKLIRGVEKLGFMGDCSGRGATKRSSIYSLNPEVAGLGAPLIGRGGFRQGRGGMVAGRDVVAGRSRRTEGRGGFRQGRGGMVAGRTGSPAHAVGTFRARKLDKRVMVAGRDMSNGARIREEFLRRKRAMEQKEPSIKLPTSPFTQPITPPAVDPQTPHISVPREFYPSPSPETPFIPPPSLPRRDMPSPETPFIPPPSLPRRDMPQDVITPSEEFVTPSSEYVTEKYSDDGYSPDGGGGDGFSPDILEDEFAPDGGGWDDGGWEDGGGEDYGFGEAPLKGGRSK